MRYAIVLTTINIPELLLEYANNFEKYNHKKEVDFIVIGDLKTPSAAEKVTDTLLRREFEGVYLDVEKQKKWLKRFPDLDKIVPYNSDNRRNIGYLLAKERGAEIIISIDDDNWPQDNKDYLLGHKIIGTKQNLPTVSSKNNWYNICRHLETEPKRIIYPRGFPYSKRKKDTADFSISEGRIVMNAGLWLQDPDVDAVTNLNEPIKVVSVDEKQYLLSIGTFSPINTQNTALHIDALPCYWYVRMGEIIQGRKIDRYGDIWSGFFAQKVIHHIGDRISFGPSVAIHRRNLHNLLKDLQEEMGGMILTEKLVPILEEIKLSKTTYSDSYLELSEKIADAIKKSEDFLEEEKRYFQKITEAMKIWVETCNKVKK